MPLVMFEYIEVNLIGIVLLLTMLLYVEKRHDAARSRAQSHFVRMLVMNALILAADNGIYLCDNHPTQGLIILNHASCIVFFMLHSWFCYEWALYVIVRLYPRYQFSRTERSLLLLPTIASSVCVVLTPLTGWIYTVSADNVYYRGPFLTITSVASMVYWVVSTAAVIKECRHPTRSRKLGDYLALLLFPVLVLIGNLLQLYFYGLSIVWICSAVSMLMLFIDMQNDVLSRDGLTGLYNRGQCNAQLQWEISHPRQSGDLMMVAMLDVDRFKQINDRFGHLSGDEALTRIAGVLKKCCRKSDFVCRFGGDEFLLIGHVSSVEDAAGIVSRIEAGLEEANAEKKLPYTLSLSIGFALFGPEDKVTMDSVLSEADSRMYEVKRRKKAARLQASSACPEASGPEPLAQH
jgi:diguanylate cyclase (GGDEF)-like protein